MNPNKKYKILVNGQNFLLEMDDSKTKMGFYTTIYLEASNPDEAEFAAADLLRVDAKLRPLALNAPNDPPAMLVEEIVELQSFDGCKLPRTGFTFYKEDIVS
jgi:hypothetical protein